MKERRWNVYVWRDVRYIILKPQIIVANSEQYKTINFLFLRLRVTVSIRR